jgi:succinate dehydrogenase flavin-adding protein (antitoxin of CptAB toxin-antitoxin module)
MRELDEMLLGWIERHYAGAGDVRREAFAAILSLPEPELIAYLLSGREATDPLTADVIHQIRDSPKA